MFFFSIWTAQSSLDLKWSQSDGIRIGGYTGTAYAWAETKRFHMSTYVALSLCPTQETIPSQTICFAVLAEV